MESSVDVAMAAGSGAVMAVAMLPSAVFTLRLHHRLGAGPTGLGAFTAGYLGVWFVIGAVAMLAFDELDRVGGPVVVATAALGAAAYQGSPLARRFLNRCRSPLGLLLLNSRPGPLGTTRLGGVYALWCAGCCAGLVAAVVLLGVAGAAGMLAMGVIVLAEKRAASGLVLSQVVAVALALSVVGTVLT